MGFRLPNTNAVSTHRPLVPEPICILHDPSPFSEQRQTGGCLPGPIRLTFQLVTPVSLPTSFVTRLYCGFQNQIQLDSDLGNSTMPLRSASNLSLWYLFPHKVPSLG